MAAVLVVRSKTTPTIKSSNRDSSRLLRMVQSIIQMCGHRHGGSTTTAMTIPTGEASARNIDQDVITSGLTFNDLGMPQ